MMHDVIPFPIGYIYLPRLVHVPAGIAIRSRLREAALLAVEHDAHKLLLIDLAVPVQVELVYHGLPI